MSVSYELTVLILGISFTAQFVANWATKRRGKKVEEKKEAEVGERKKERRRRGEKRNTTPPISARIESIDLTLISTSRSSGVERAPACQAAAYLSIVNSSIVNSSFPSEFGR